MINRKVLIKYYYVNKKVWFYRFFSVSLRFNISVYDCKIIKNEI